jgi:hypothetical protein
MWRKILLLTILPLTACATITTGTRESLIVGSSPAGADAKLVCEGLPAGSGVTPATITIRRNAGDCDLTIAKDGYESQTVHIEQGVNPAYWPNLIASPLVPAGALVALVGDSSNDQQLGSALVAAGAVVIFTDFCTGAIHRHRPDKIDVTLKANR